MDAKNQERLDRWHHIVFARDHSALSAILAEDVEFYSPFVWKPYTGRLPTFIILSNVIEVFTDFTYHRQVIDGDTWALEFSARVGDLSLKGIDLIGWNDQGQIATFEVFVRPFNGLQALGAAMQERLQAAGFR